MVLLLSSNGYHFFYILFIIQRVLHFTSHFCFNFNRLVLTCTLTLDLNQNDFEHDDLWPIFIILMQFCFIISASPVSFIIRTHCFLYRAHILWDAITGREHAFPLHLATFWCLLCRLYCVSTTLATDRYDAQERRIERSCRTTHETAFKKFDTKMSLTRWNYWLSPSLHEKEVNSIKISLYT